jgi:hypothetical protein
MLILLIVMSLRVYYHIGVDALVIMFQVLMFIDVRVIIEFVYISPLPCKRYVEPVLHV